MQSIEIQAEPSVIWRTLLAGGLGSALGLVGGRLAMAFSAPWYGAAFVWMGYTFLGVSLGLTAGRKWWARGAGIGLGVGIACGLGWLAIGMRWVPFGLAIVIGSVVSGLLVALILDSIYPMAQQAAGRKVRVVLCQADTGRIEPRANTAVGQRLRREMSILEDLNRERSRRNKPALGKAVEHRIVWCELLDLELQDIDERLDKICQVIATQGPPA